MLKQVVNDIKELRIQGATNIAYAGLVALRSVVNNSSRSNNSFIRELEKARDLLVNARPNEPMMKNAIDYVINKVLNTESNIKSEALKTIEYLEDKFTHDRKLMAKHGKGLIPRGSKVFTHCHASSVMAVFKESRSNIKSAYCTESRPRYQGRITAKELIRMRIPTTMVVDSAVADYIKKVDAFFIGCDVITSTSIINKVGSKMISILCDKYDIPLYVCTLSYKFDPESISGFRREVEKREIKEVWDKPPKGLRIRNPAFDEVDFEGITGFVTELGVLPPNAFINIMSQKNELFN